MRADDMTAIVNVVNLYSVALDAHRYELFEKVFTADVRCDFGGGAAWADRDSLTAAFRNIHAVFSATQHQVSNHTITITIDGDEAHCLSYVHARFLRDLAESEGEGLFDSTGWYDDKLVRTADGWRIADRTSCMVSATGNVRVMQVMPDVDTNFNLLPLAREADAGRVKFFNAMLAR